jgi:hypothetical protein
VHFCLGEHHASWRHRAKLLKKPPPRGQRGVSLHQGLPVNLEEKRIGEPGTNWLPP